VTQRCAERFWTDKIEIASLSQNLEQIAVSDQTTLEGLTQFATTTILRIALNGWQQAKYIRLVIREGAFCATLFQAVRKSLILNGEILERSIRHAWKSTPAARADAHQIRPTHFRSTTSHNLHTRRRVLVNHGVDRGFPGVCDTVLTQDALAVGEIPFGVRWYGFPPTRRSMSESPASLRVPPRTFRPYRR
jgi:hypothetical protein